MKQFVVTLAFFSLLFLLSAKIAVAQSPAVAIVFDEKTTAQAHANGVAATASEEAINKEFEAMKQEQQKVQRMILVVEQHLSKVEKIQKDISAFKREGAAISLFVFKTKRALKSLSNLAKAGNGNEIGLIASYKKIYSVSTDIYSICGDMVSTVVDAKFALPGLKQPKPKDELNLLEPQQRLAFYERCSHEMDIINYKLQGLQYMIKSNNTLQRAAITIDPTTYWTVEYGKSIANDIISLWKR